MSAPCPVCEGSLAERFPQVLDPHARGTYSIEVCGQCGHGVTRPVPSDLAPHYPKDYYGGRHGMTHRWCLARRLGWLRSVADKGSRILDIGAGDGSFVERANQQGFDATGMERNPEPLRQRGLKVVTGLEDAKNSGPYDVVTMWHSLEHFPDVREILGGAAALLSPGGKMLVAVPRANSLQARTTGASWLHLDVPRHLHHFTDRSLERLVQLFGLQVVRTWRHEYEYDVMGWIQGFQNKVIPTPNLFFRMVTGHKDDVGWGQKASALGLGAMGVLTLGPWTALEALFNRSGTLVVLAERGR